MTRAAAFTAALGALLASPASAQSPTPAAFTAISPIFGQLVAFSMPSTFVTSFENTNGPSYIREAVPKGETVKDWTQMITVTGAKATAANPKVSPESFASSMAAGFKRACPDTYSTKPFGPAKFGNQYAYVAVISCGRIETSDDKHGETALIITIKGSSDYYTLQWAERAPTAGTNAIDEAKWQARLRQLQPIRLCPIRPGERAPYPSCASKN